MTYQLQNSSFTQRTLVNMHLFGEVDLAPSRLMSSWSRRESAMARRAAPSGGLLKDGGIVQGILSVKTTYSGEQELQIYNY